MSDGDLLTPSLQVSLAGSWTFALLLVTLRQGQVPIVLLAAHTHHIWHSTAQHSTTQHSTAQPSTAQQVAFPCVRTILRSQISNVLDEDEKRVAAQPQPQKYARDALPLKLLENKRLCTLVCLQRHCNTIRKLAMNDE